MRRLIAFFCALLMFISVNAQDKVIKGKVVDAKGNPVPGATITAVGAGRATVTEADGTFEIRVPSNVSTIEISSIGFGTVQKGVNDNLTAITLSEVQQSMDEVVVVGFGAKIKRDLTGNIARVKGEEVKNVPVPNFTQALQGRASGVMVESQSGRVGGGIKVRVRGSGSISANNEPLYVIDGIPITTGSISGNSLADFNFNDVESFEILKDASAAAIYGSRAANGVVLITTKKGRSGKTRFNVGVQYGANKPTGYREFLNNKEYTDNFTEAARRGAIYHYNREGNYFGYSSEQEAIDDWVGFVESRFRRYDGHVDWTTGETNTNWEKLAFNDDAKTFTVDISAQGGNEKTRFYMSGGYTNQDGILIGNNFGRYSGRVNLEHDVTSKFKMGMNMSLSRTKGRLVPADNEFSTPMQIVALSPITPVRDTLGNLYNTPTTTYYNPLVDYEDASQTYINYRTLGTIYGQYNFLPNLFFRTENSVDLFDQENDEFYGSKTINGRSTNGYGRYTTQRSFNVNTNNYFNYNQTFGGVHDLDAILGMSLQQSRSDFSQVIGEDFPSDALQNLASAGKITGGSSSETNYAFVSYFARANYKYDNRFLLSLSARIDGSSRFGENSRYGFFPAVSAGWIITNEKFLDNSSTDWLSFLKLRASWGLTGNADGIGDFPQRGLWGASKYNLQSSLVPTQLANPNLEWEKSNQFDVGLDFGFFKNRLSGEIDYYVRKTTDLLYNTPVPGTSGFTSQFTNVGAMQNDGFEFVLNSVNMNRKDFRWTTSLNLAWNNNKITKLDGISDTLPGNDGRYLNSLIVGQPIGVFYGPKYAGVDPTNGDGIFYLQDGKTTTADYNEAGNFIVGDPNPDFIYGMTNTLTWKGLEFSFLIQGVMGNQIMNGAGGFMSANFDWFDNPTRDQLSYWKKPGDITMVPEARLNLSGFQNGIGASSRYVEDGDYLRFKTVTLGYTLPAKWSSKAKFSSVRVYFTGQNLWTITGYNGWDPEVNADYRSGNRNQGSDFYSAPQIKSFVFGLNLGF